MMLPFPFLNQTRWPQRFWFFLLLVLSSSYLSAQSTVVPLYPGVAPGSEQWNWEEGQTANTPRRFRIAYNVTRPTLTVYKPDTANGAAVILFPGGGMYVVNIENEGEVVAKKLVKKGLTVFVLKYRTGRTTSADPWQEMLGNLRDTALNRKKLEGVRSLSIADAFAAVRYVRNHAAQYNLDVKKIGAVGFSAGGSLTLRLSNTTDEDSRPDFVGLIYTVYRPVAGDTLPHSVPPAFIACATDDALAPPVNSIAIYDAWVKAKRSAELHIYATGGHGLNGGQAHTWVSRFIDWMETIGMLKPDK